MYYNLEVGDCRDIVALTTIGVKDNVSGPMCQDFDTGSDNSVTLSKSLSSNLESLH